LRRVNGLRVRDGIFVSIDDDVDGLSVDLAAAAAVLRGELKRDAAGMADVKVAGQAPRRGKPQRRP